MGYISLYQLFNIRWKDKEFDSFIGILVDKLKDLPENGAYISIINPHITYNYNFEVKDNINTNDDRDLIAILKDRYDGISDINIQYGESKYCVSSISYWFYGKDKDIYIKSFRPNRINKISSLNQSTYQSPVYPSNYSLEERMSLATMSMITATPKFTYTISDLYISSSQFYISESIVTEIEESFPLSDNNQQDDNYQYSEVLEPYNDMILAFSDSEEYKNHHETTTKEDIKEWLDLNYKQYMRNDKFKRVFADLIFDEYELITKTGVNANKKRKK